MRWLLVLAIVGCGDSGSGIDAASPAFNLHVELVWSSTATPDVVAVTVDGVTLPDGELYKVDEIYDSYADAAGSFAPKSVAVMTASGATSGLLKMYTCSDVPQDQLKSIGRVVGEKDRYVVHADHMPEWDSGDCEGVDGTVGAITRSARTR